MKRYGVIIIIAFLIGVSIFSISKFIFTERQNYMLSKNLNQISVQIDKLELQRRSYMQTIQAQDQEKAALRTELQTNQERLSKMEEDLLEAKKVVDDLQSEVSLVKAENSSLRQSEENLKEQLSETSQERQSLQSRLDSLVELKKALRELKVKMHQEKVAIRQRANQDMLLTGNRGYIIQQGKSTYPTKFRIEVVPAQ